MSTETFDPKRLLAAPSIRRMLEDFVRRRVSPSDVDDVVQTVLVEALASTTRLADEEELRRFVMGIAKHKVVDHHRRTSREAAAEIPDVAVSPGPIEARALVEWAEKQAGPSNEAKSTLAWMAREGEGEKLEAIAESEQVPAARIRQRVSRMRRWMKEKWIAELAAAAALALVVIGLWRLLRKEEPIANPLPDTPRTTDIPDKPLPVEERAQKLRTAAFEACGRAAWLECLDKFNEAKAIDPEGDKDPQIGAARERALDALRSQAPAPTSKEQEPTKVTPKSTTTFAPKPPAPKAPPPVKKDSPTQEKTAPLKPKSKFSDMKK